MFKQLFGVIFIGAAICASAFGQRSLGARPTESGGVLMAEQAAYDVKHYDLALAVDVPNQSITGVLTARALITSPIDKFVLDLDSPFTVESVALVNGKSSSALKFERRGGKIWIDFGKTMAKGKTVNVRVAYIGKPKIAPAPPWAGGFVWSKSAD